MIKDDYEERNGILEYRQMTMKLNREHDLNVNHKRIYRLMNILQLKTVCRRKKKNYIPSTPEFTAENVLNRKFESDRFGTRWLTDVTEMKYGLQSKAYLSAILDLSDKSIVFLWWGIPTTMNLLLELLISHIKHTMMRNPSFIVTEGSNIRANYLRRNWTMLE